jgi:sugar/nucleoside kinase (ribokinase family)
MDSFAADGRTHAAHLLAAASEAGLQTSVDMVSTEHPQFREIALSAMPHTDHLIINEIEASRVLNRTLSSSDGSVLLKASRDLLALGVRQTVTIHTEHGASACTHEKDEHFQPSLLLPAGYSQGATGAGDAFAAGLLYALHEGWSLADRLRLAVCTAAASLSHPTPSGGMKPVRECLALADTFGFRE